MIKSHNESLNELLKERLQTCFEGKPWYGRNMTSILDKYAPLSEQSKKILKHMIVWRTFVNAALNGIDYSIELNSAADWPESSISEDDLRNELNDIQNELLESISNFENDRWREKLPDGKYSFVEIVHGVIDHDLYHIGQIAILQKGV